jgi:hypothetical protein
MEAQRGQETCPMTHSQEVAESGRVQVWTISETKLSLTTAPQKLNTENPDMQKIEGRVALPVILRTHFILYTSFEICIHIYAQRCLTKYIL